MDGLNQDAKLLEGHSSQLLEHLKFKQKGLLVKDLEKFLEGKGIGRGQK